MTSRTKLAVLRRHCDAETLRRRDTATPRHCDAETRDAETRDADVIEKTVLVMRSPLTDTSAFLAEVDAASALGVTEVQIMPSGHPVEYPQQVAERVLARLADI